MRQTFKQGVKSQIPSQYALNDIWFISYVTHHPEDLCAKPDMPYVNLRDTLRKASY